MDKELLIAFTKQLVSELKAALPTAIQKYFETNPPPQGEPGKDAEVDIVELVEALKGDDWFLSISKGEVGEQGDQGEQGAPAVVDYDQIKNYVSEEVVKLASDPQLHDAIAEEVFPDIIDTIKSEVANIPLLNGQDGIGFDAKRWSPAIYRQGAVVQHNIGQVFRSKVDTNEEPSQGDDWERLGLNGFRFTGGYKSDFDYSEGDFAVKDYGLMLHTAGEFRLIVGRGEKGAKGDKGTPGEDGRDGINGRDGSSIDSVEFNGTSIALMFRNPDKTLSSHIIDLEPMYKTLLDMQDARFKAFKREIIKEIARGKAGSADV